MNTKLTVQAVAAFNAGTFAACHVVESVGVGAESVCIGSHRHNDGVERIRACAVRIQPRGSLAAAVKPYTAIFLCAFKRSGEQLRAALHRNLQLCVFISH